MEELRSTEILIKEIQEDARKKAEKTLAQADGDCKAVHAGVEAQVEEAVKEREGEYEKKIALFRQEKDTALTLEKKRYMVSFEWNALIKAMDDYLISISQAGRLELLKGMLTGFASAVRGKGIHALVYGIPPGDAEKMLRGIFGPRALTGCAEIPFQKTGEVPVEGISMREGIIIETEDGGIRIRGTLDEFVRDVLDGNRYELGAALFGGRLPE
jgi:V/A-type H+-transporting ATPase subunit E